MSGWKPIASAPKDGTEILVYAPWLADDGERNITTVFWDGSDWYLCQLGGHAESSEPDGRPTHWMSLPSPPGQSRTRIRSAKHGQFASKDDADASPDTHIRETVR